MQTSGTLLLVAAALVVAAGRRQTPLRDPLEPGRTRSAECQFGRQMKELGSTWFADLGPPFGVMYCIKCECVAVQKKRRIVARTHCRNIKSECPQPSCEDPVLMPGRCCKTCPDDYSPDMMDPPPSIDDEDKNMKDYAALLTGRTSLVLKRDDALMAPSTSHNSYDLVATGRFTFHRRNLYYSFYTPETAGRPRALQFVDVEGNILEEQALLPPDGVLRSQYQNATGKVCGVWRRVPRDYRRLIREERLYVWLIWGGGSWPEQSLSGQVARYKALSSETFSSLLQPARDGDRVAMHGAGGTAIVSMKHGTPSVHVSLVFNGVFAPDEIENVPVVVRLEHPEKDRVVIEEEVRVLKPAHELNVVEVRSPVSAQDLRHLTRGHLVLSVASRRSPRELRLQGRVGPRVACEIFQTPLSSVYPDPEDKDSQEPEAGGAAGLAWLYVARDGSLAYSVQVAGLPDGETPYVTVSSGRGRRREDLEDLTPSFQRGWANGSVGAPGPRELEELYAGELSVDVVRAGRAAVTRGRLQARPVADARDSPSPALLTRAPGAPGPLELVGLAWTAVLEDCSLVYEVVMSGLSPHDHALQLYLESVPFDLPGAPRSRRLLEDFRGDQVEGFSNAASPGDLMQLEAGVSFLEVVDAGTQAVLLRGRIAQAKLPLNCLPQYRDNDVPADPQTQTHGDTPPEGKTCFHEGAFREDGGQWRPRSDPCLVCSCLRGHTRCDAVVCPPLRCGEGAAPARPSSRECCPVCNVTVQQESNTSATRGCYMGGLFYPAGRSWHPYLPPNGFDTCTVCSCAADTLEVHYHRAECPPLACDEKLAVRPDKKACCRQCPPAPPGDEPGDQPLALTARPAARAAQDVLASGGCRGAGGGGFYENGEEWHPRVSPHGEIKCVTCSCKDGKMKCERKRCPRSACRAGQASDSTDECCPLCKRHRRHHKPPANS